MIFSCGGLAAILLASAVLPASMAIKLGSTVAVAAQLAERGPAALILIVFAGIGCLVLLRYLLLSLLNPRR